MKNGSSIATARDADLRLSAQALQRAAVRAREVARQTGTAIVVSRDGAIETLRPSPSDEAPTPLSPERRAAVGDSRPP